MNWEDEQIIKIWAVARPRRTKLLMRIGRAIGAPVVSETLFLAQMDTLRRTSAERTDLKQQVRQREKIDTTGHTHVKHKAWHKDRRYTEVWVSADGKIWNMLGMEGPRRVPHPDPADAETKSIG